MKRMLSGPEGKNIKFFMERHSPHSFCYIRCILSNTLLIYFRVNRFVTSRNRRFHMIYMDNAATSWPKPSEVVRAVTECMEKYGANPGRSGHKMAVQAGHILLYTREMLCELFNLQDPFQIIYTF